MIIEIYKLPEAVNKVKFCSRQAYCKINTKRIKNQKAPGIKFNLIMDLLFTGVKI